MARCRSRLACGTDQRGIYMMQRDQRMRSRAHQGEGRRRRAAGSPNTQASGMPSIAHSHAQGFRHEAMLYAGEQGFVKGALRFLREGVARREPALVIVSARKIALLRDALGADAAHVRFDDIADVGANPARIIPTWTAFVRE